jgi:hypothetical protein
MLRWLGRSPPHERRYAGLFERFCGGSECPASLSEAVVALCRELITSGLSAMDLKGVHDGLVDAPADPDEPRVIAATGCSLEMLFACGAEFSALSERLLAEADAAEGATSERRRASRGRSPCAPRGRYRRAAFVVRLGDGVVAIVGLIVRRFAAIRVRRRSR